MLKNQQLRHRSIFVAIVDRLQRKEKPFQLDSAGSCPGNLEPRFVVIHDRRIGLELLVDAFADDAVDVVTLLAALADYFDGFVAENLVVLS